MNKDQIVDVINAGWINYEFNKSVEEMMRDYGVSEKLARIGIKMFNYLKSIKLNEKPIKNAN